MIASTVPFDIVSAFIVGVAVPVLETWIEYCRHDFRLSAGDILSNLDDYVVGAVLLIAAWMFLRRRSYAPVLLVAAWAYCTSLFVSSSWGQVQDTFGGHPEPENGVILTGKLILLAVSVASLIVAFRRAWHGSAESRV